MSFTEALPCVCSDQSIHAGDGHQSWRKEKETEMRATKFTRILIIPRVDHQIIDMSRNTAVIFLGIALATLTPATSRHDMREKLEPIHLPFDYIPFSPGGPPRWHEVNVTGNDWEKFVGHDKLDLDIDGNECDGDRRRPSPINLIATAKCRDNHEILTRQPRETDCTFDSLDFTSTPYTLRANFPLDDAQCIRPTIDLPNGYPFRWHAYLIEVHLRSEHLLDGRRYDGELQMYHLGQGDQKRQLAAVSVMLDASAYFDNPKLQMYIDEWQVIANEMQTNCTKRRELSSGERDGMTSRNKSGKDVAGAVHDQDSRQDKERRQLQDEEDEENYGPRRKMFPYDIWPTIYYYRYRGQITTPPCSQIVSWRVLDEPLRISRKQYKQLAHLMTGYIDGDTCENSSAASPRGESYRPVQQMNELYQNVTHCTEEDFTFWMYPPSQQ